jgi:hypothetical protein
LKGQSSHASRPISSKTTPFATTSLAANLTKSPNHIMEVSPPLSKDGSVEVPVDLLKSENSLDHHSQLRIDRPKQGPSVHHPWSLEKTRRIHRDRIPERAKEGQKIWISDSKARVANHSMAIED